ncbi:unnamed protein product, partial [Auanema sp. JU1783]
MDLARRSIAIAQVLCEPYVFPLDPAELKDYILGRREEAKGILFQLQPSLVLYEYHMNAAIEFATKIGNRSHPAYPKEFVAHRQLWAEFIRNQLRELMTQTGNSPTSSSLEDETQGDGTSFRNASSIDIVNEDNTQRSKSPQQQAVAPTDEDNTPKANRTNLDDSFSTFKTPQTTAKKPKRIPNQYVTTFKKDRNLKWAKCSLSGI